MKPALLPSVVMHRARAACVAFLLLAGDAAPQIPPARGASSELRARIAAGARRQVGVTRIYDPSYWRLRYPGGDLPLERGVCADVVVRAFRAIGVDLQRELHEDMRRHFSAYPKMWRLSGPDSNIDHRRVPNLMRFFERRGKSLSAPGTGPSKRATSSRGDCRAGCITSGSLLRNEPSTAAGR
jgi:hypothetical protein